MSALPSRMAFMRSASSVADNGPAAGSAACRVTIPSAAAPMTRVEKRFAGDDVFTKQVRMRQWNCAALIRLATRGSAQAVNYARRDKRR